MLEEKFVVAIAHWKLEVLYVALTSAKQQVYPGKRKKLTAIEQACLRGLLCRYSPSEIARELYREPGGLRVDLCRGLYRYIEMLTHQQLEDWRDVSRVLAAAGYQKATNYEALDQAMTEVLPHITEDDAISWFNHCGLFT